MIIQVLYFIKIMMEIVVKHSAELGRNSNFIIFACHFSAIRTTSITPASSELCRNFSQARIADVIWLSEFYRGAALLPKQHLNLGPWISFPAPPNLIPFDICATNEIELNNDESIYVLLETDLIPNYADDRSVQKVHTLNELHVIYLSSLLMLIIL